MSAIEDLPPLRAIIRAYGLGARKALGQNFLLDLNLTRRIARAALGGGLAEKTGVIEIGPGPGGLTRALIQQGAAALVVIERDQRCLPALQQIKDASPAALSIVHEDALRADYAELATDLKAHIGANERIIIAANLPYNIATPLLLMWLQTQPWPPWYDQMTLMFQREVAERLVAPAGGPQYGRLSVLTQLRTRARILFDISPRAFTPAPKVTSSLVQLTPRSTPAGCDIKLLSTVTAAAFGQRRKMLRSSLKTLGVDTPALLKAAGIESTARAQTISIEGFVALTRAYAKCAL